MPSCVLNWAHYPLLKLISLRFLRGGKILEWESPFCHWEIMRQCRNLPVQETLISFFFMLQLLLYFSRKTRRFLLVNFYMYLLEILAS